MADHILKESFNMEARHLHQKATVLAASALASSTKSNYRKAWGRFQSICDKMRIDPLEASRPDIVTWLVYRSK